MTNESENTPARRVDDKHPGTTVDWSDAPRFNALGIAETWSVTVEAEGKRVLIIGDQYVAGLDTDELEPFSATIRSCAMHLLGFIGAVPVAAHAKPAYRAPAAATVLTDERIDEITRGLFADGTFTSDDLTLARAIESEVLAHAGVTAEPAMERDGWMVDGSLIYRLNDKGVNCDEINITMVNGSRATEVRHDAAVELLAELTRAAPTIPAQVPAAEVRAAEEGGAA